MAGQLRFFSNYHQQHGHRDRVRRHSHLRQRPCLPEEAGQRACRLYANVGDGRGESLPNNVENSLPGSSQVARYLVLLCSIIHTSTSRFLYSSEHFFEELAASPTGTSRAPWTVTVKRPRPSSTPFSSIPPGMPYKQVLKKDHLLCDDPDDCDYTRGGYFTTQRAR